MSAEGVETSVPRTGVPPRWVADLPANASTETLAQAVLEVRLHAVEDYLAQAERLRRPKRTKPAAPPEAASPPAAEDAPDSAGDAPPAATESPAAETATVAAAESSAPTPAEVIHHLRTSTRRAGAALAVFRAWLPKRGYREWADRLRAIRGAAGMARNCDVLEERWKREAGDAPGAEWSLPLRWLDHTREAAQREVLSLVRDLRRKGAERRIADFVGKLRWRGAGPAPGARCWAVGQLQEVVSEFREASEPAEDAADEAAAVEQLHQRRIAAKRLRYALEVFAPVLPQDECEELYAVVEQIQERLGALNDHATAADLIDGWLKGAGRKRTRGDLKARRRHEREQIQIQKAEFEAWWSGVERRFHERLDALAELDSPARYRVVAS